MTRISWEDDKRRCRDDKSCQGIWNLYHKGWMIKYKDWINDN